MSSLAHIHLSGHLLGGIEVVQKETPYNINTNIARYIILGGHGKDQCTNFV